MKESTKLLHAAEGRYRAYLARKNMTEDERRLMQQGSIKEPAKLVVPRKKQWWNPARTKRKGTWVSRLEESQKDL